MPISTAPAVTTMTTGVVARSTFTSGRRRLSQATIKGPAVPNSISTTPMARPMACAQGAASGAGGTAGRGRSALRPTAATYRPSTNSGQRGSSTPLSHSPAAMPAAMPGSRRRSSAKFTWRRFRPPSSRDAGTSSSSVKATTSGKGQRQASKGTMISAEPKPVMPSTT
ncbi:hypothetical protein D3C78_1038500 [compost metagenome]